MNTFRSIIIAFAAAALAQAATTVAGGTITLTGSPTPISSVHRKVNQVSIKIVPGFACKVYVGTTTHSRTTLTGVFAVLFPNSVGGHSEVWSLRDPRPNDGIQLQNIAISTDCPGEQVTYHWLQTGTEVANLDLLRSGPLPGGNALWSGSTTTAQVVDVRVIPGMSGKIRVKIGTGEVAVLFPNSGNPNQSNAHSECWQLWDSASLPNDAFKPSNGSIVADVPGEAALVTLWRIV
jgi:hypothetical protein